jgi:galactokinase
MIECLGYRGDLQDRQALAARLCEAGLGAEAASARAERFAEAAAALAAREPRAADRQPLAFFVPGRIEVLGKHTDYAGGRSMVVATERGFSLVAVPRDDAAVIVVDAANGQSTEFELSPALTPTVGHWSNYPMTVARRIARNFPGPCRGATIALASDLPPAAGMSSSSAFMVAVFFALAEANGLYERPEFRENVHNLTDLAGYLGTIENGQSFGSLVGDRGVGTFGGSEDHTAMLCARPGQVRQYAYCPVRFERAIPIPPSHTFAVGVSGVVAEKTGAAMEKYNTASRLAQKLVEIWQHETGRSEAHLASIVDSGPDAVSRLVAAVRETASESEVESLLRRLRHFVAENEEILPTAGDTLAGGDVQAFGLQVDRSQREAEGLLGNQITETSYLAAAARGAGAAAASAFGAGFGGSVWALVAASGAEAFLASWAALYRARFPVRSRSAAFFLTGAGPASMRVC